MSYIHEIRVRLPGRLPPMIVAAGREHLQQILSAARPTIFTAEEVECLEEDFLNLEDADRFVVALEGEEVVGFAQWGPLAITDRAWCLYWICVSQKIQGRGVGRELLAEVERSVADEGGRILFIETSSRDIYIPTRAFYEKCGYDIAAIVGDYYGLGDSKVVFSKRTS